jgi:hypothetical protein
MKTAAVSPHTEAAIWLRILHPDGELAPKTARAILQLAFPESEKDYMHELSAKARAGTLTSEEEQKMDAYERVGALLSILKSKARQALKKAPVFGIAPS